METVKFYSRKFKEMDNNNTIVHRELPISSYEVIHLPNHKSKKSPVVKGSLEPQQAVKRQKVTPPVTSQADEFRSTTNTKCLSLTKTLTKSQVFRERQPRTKRQKVVPSVASQADELRSTPTADCPSFTKTLVRSHVSGCYWMGLPQPFCRMHLPTVDTYVVLENENGKRYGVKYLADRTAFSGRWREFSLAEKLSEGDVLLFQLVNPTRFKVRRLNNSVANEVNGDCATLNLDAGLAQSGSNVNDAVNLDDNDLEKNKKTREASPRETVSRDKDQETVLSENDDGETVQKMENVQKSTPECNSGDHKHLPSPPTISDHYSIADFDDFIILLDGLLQKDYNLPHNIKQSYYQLCSSQRSILHVDLLKNINPVLIAGCIIETVDIADAMKSCELPNFENHFTIWDRKLKSLAALGMRVSFLSARLLHLQTLSHDSEFTKYKQQYTDLSSEHAESENIIESLQEKIAELIRVSEKRVEDIKKLETQIKEHEKRFQEQVSAPW